MLDQCGLPLHVCPQCSGMVLTIPDGSKIATGYTYWVCTGCGRRFMDDRRSKPQTMSRRRAVPAPVDWGKA
jgi:hypothetical protein